MTKKQLRAVIKMAFWADEKCLNDEEYKILENWLEQECKDLGFIDFADAYHKLDIK